MSAVAGRRIEERNDNAQSAQPLIAQIAGKRRAERTDNAKYAQLRQSDSCRHKQQGTPTQTSPTERPKEAHTTRGLTSNNQNARNETSQARKVPIHRSKHRQRRDRMNENRRENPLPHVHCARSAVDDNKEEKGEGHDKRECTWHKTRNE